MEALIIFKLDTKYIKMTFRIEFSPYLGFEPDLKKYSACCVAAGDGCLSPCILRVHIYRSFVIKFILLFLVSSNIAFPSLISPLHKIPLFPSWLSFIKQQRLILYCQNWTPFLDSSRIYQQQIFCSVFFLSKSQPGLLFLFRGTILIDNTYVFCL